MKKSLFMLMIMGLVVGVSACDDDEECVQCPETGAPGPTMANIWPHADGTAWTFDGEFRESDMSSSAVKMDSPVPSMEELHETLQEPLPGEIIDEQSGIYRLAFAGMDTTESGAIGQNLVSTYFIDPLEEMMSRMDPLVGLIAQARPDLRPALAARFKVTEKAIEQSAFPPFFLGGGAFAYEDTGYFAYADIDQEHSWVYLAGDLSVGSEFSLQLVSDLVDDIWLYGRIWGVTDRAVNGVDYDNVLECMYVVDMGEAQLTNEVGEVLGTFYPYMYGHSFFVPELGPVAGTERRVFVADPLFEEGPAQQFEFVFDLVGVTYGE